MLDYLKKYDKSVKIVNINDMDKTTIPEYWVKVLILESAEERAKKVLECWEISFALELSNTIDYLKHNLDDVLLLESNGKYSLLYCIKNLAGKIVYYQGSNPIESLKNNELLKKIGTVSPKLEEFYNKVHNGFYHYSSHAMGLVPLSEIIYFVEYDWGIIDDLKEPIKIKLDSTYGVFSSGSGGYVAIDISNKKSTVWFSNDLPDYDVKFWNVVDEWIQIGLED